MRTLCVVVIASLAACGGDGGGGGGGGGDDDGGGGGADASSTPDAALASGVAHVVKGATAPPTFRFAPPAPAAPTDGRWYVSPDQVQVKLNRVNFASATGGTGSDLTDCDLTFDKTSPSLSSLLDCPFSVDPGTYVSMTVFVDGSFKVLISDADNGIFTDPASGTGLSSTEPGGGAAFVDYVRPLGEGGVEILFPQPLVVAEGDSVALTVVLDGVQTIPMTVSGSGSSLEFGDLNYSPANVFPTIATPGNARVYTSADTADSYNDDAVLANKLRIYWDAAGQPIYAFTEQTATAINGCALPAPAYPSDPGGDPPVGGWLGRDDGGTTCWASSRDSWQTYDGYFTFSDVTTVGESGTLSCEDTTNPSPPSSGSTYASGCPSISATATDSLMLVAD